MARCRSPPHDRFGNIALTCGSGCSRRPRRPSSRTGLLSTQNYEPLCFGTRGRRRPELARLHVLHPGGGGSRPASGSFVSHLRAPFGLRLGTTPGCHGYTLEPCWWTLTDGVADFAARWVPEVGEQGALLVTEAYRPVGRAGRVVRPVSGQPECSIVRRVSTPHRSNAAAKKPAPPSQEKTT